MALCMTDTCQWHKVKIGRNRENLCHYRLAIALIYLKSMEEPIWLSNLGSNTCLIVQ